MIGRTPMLEDPTKKARIEALFEGIETKCMSTKGACRSAGVGEDRVYAWLEKAALPDAKACYVEFAERFTRALGEREEQLVQDIRDARIYGKDGASMPDWRAKAWLLERIESSSFSTKAQLDLTGEIKVKLLQIEGLPEQDD